MSIDFSGLNDLHKTLEEAKNAAELLEGEMQTLAVDPDNPGTAISQMGSGLL